MLLQVKISSKFSEKADENNDLVDLY